jgi:hypothetical protein
MTVALLLATAGILCTTAVASGCPQDLLLVLLLQEAAERGAAAEGQGEWGHQHCHHRPAAGQVQARPTRPPKQVSGPAISFCDKNVLEDCADGEAGQACAGLLACHALRAAPWDNIVCICRHYLMKSWVPGRKLMPLCFASIPHCPFSLLSCRPMGSKKPGPAQAKPVPKPFRP